MHRPVARRETLARERQSAEPVAGIGIGAGEVEAEVGLGAGERLRQQPFERRQVAIVAATDAIVTTSDGAPRSSSGRNASSDQTEPR